MIWRIIALANIALTFLLMVLVMLWGGRQKGRGQRRTVTFRSRQGGFKPRSG